MCRLRLERHPDTDDADITELTHDSAGQRLDYLVVCYRDGPFDRRTVVGACDGVVTADTVERFRAEICAGQRAERSHLVQRSPEVDPALVAAAADGGIWLRSWADYQRVWTHDRYLTGQQSDLRADPAYPLALHIDKHWAPLGVGDPEPTTAARQILSWLGTDGPRFVLVLGMAGTGKTFLLHALADELARAEGLVPVLVTMRDLEKGRTLDELLAQHMSKHREDPFHLRSFRYLLRQGRLALLFDGFDELALRTSSSGCHTTSPPSGRPPRVQRRWW